MMEQIATIDNLPLEILTMIIEFMDYEQILSVSLVSKRWNEAVSNSLKFLDKTRLHLNINESFKNNFEVTRPYRALKIDSRSTDDRPLIVTLEPQFLNSIQTFSSYLRLIKLSGVNISYEDFDDFFESCSDSLEELYLWSVSPTTRENVRNKKKVKLPNLKKLKALASCMILDRFECENVEYLEFNSECIETGQINDFKSKKFIKFLNHFKNLKVILIHFFDISSNFNLEMQANWNHLKIFCVIKDVYLKNLSRLLAYAGSESKISIEYHSEIFSTKALNEIATNSNITKMKLVMEVIPLEDATYDELLPFQHIKSLKIRESSKSPSNDHRIFKFVKTSLFPRLEHLDIQFDCNYENSLGPEHLLEVMNLKTLRLGNIYDSMIPFLFIPLLETLEILQFDIEDCERLIAFTGDYESLKHVKLHLNDFKLYGEYLFIRLCLTTQIKTFEIIDSETEEVYEGKYEEINKKLIKTVQKFVK